MVVPNTYLSRIGWAKPKVDTPVMRVSNDNGATFGPLLTLAANGTIGEAEERLTTGENEGWD